MLNFISSCNIFVTRLAGETPKAWRERWERTYDEIVEKFPNAAEIRDGSGFWVVEDTYGNDVRVAYFSLHGIDFE
jgi:hypothetical protein